MQRRAPRRPAQAAHRREQEGRVAGLHDPQRPLRRPDQRQRLFRTDCAGHVQFAGLILSRGSPPTSKMRTSSAWIGASTRRSRIASSISAASCSGGVLTTRMAATATPGDSSSPPSIACTECGLIHTQDGGGHVQEDEGRSTSSSGGSRRTGFWRDVVRPASRQPRRPLRRRLHPRRSRGRRHRQRGAPVWHDDGSEGPDQLGKLSPGCSFAACGNGRRQSPIHISKAAPGATWRS